MVDHESLTNQARLALPTHARTSLLSLEATTDPEERAALLTGIADELETDAENLAADTGGTIAPMSEQHVAAMSELRHVQASLFALWAQHERAAHARKIAGR